MSLMDMTIDELVKNFSEDALYDFAIAEEGKHTTIWEEIHNCYDKIKELRKQEKESYELMTKLWRAKYISATSKREVKP